MKFLIAGGGTGGHLFPGVAIAQTLQQRNPKYEICFVGTASGIEAREMPKLGFKLLLIQVSGLKGKSLWQKFESLVSLPKAIWQSIGILRKEAPNVVIGVGGYASGPVLLAAWILRIPRVICEQNSIPGFTNRILGRYFVKHIFCAFEKSQSYFKPGTCLVTGNPLRFEGQKLPQKDPQKVVVLGGSQGAHILNEVVPKAMAMVQKQVPNIRVYHQTGQADLGLVKAAYEQASVQAEVVAFVDNMAEDYTKALLVIARSGAMSCSEIAFMGLPSILIPLPTAADDHQTENAQELVLAKAAVLMPQNKMTPESLAAMVVHLLTDLKSLENMANNAQKVGKPDAAARVVQKVLELC